jgi:hypothetical protein
VTGIINWPGYRIRIGSGVRGHIDELFAQDKQLFQIEKSSHMAKRDLRSRAVNHRTRDSIEAHLAIASAAVTVSRWIGSRTG